MRTHIAQDMLDKMLVGAQLDKSDLRKLVTVDGEGRYIEFKHGMITKDKDAFRSAVRENVSAFANVDGGLLVVGVSNTPPRTFTQTTRQGEQPLNEWCARILTEMTPWLSPLPRIQVIKIDGSEVLVVGTERSPSLVPCIDRRGSRYFIRLEDQTLGLPESLASDILLGRRAHPVLKVRDPFGAINRAQRGYSIHFAVAVDNEGLVAAESFEVGAVSWGFPGPPVHQQLPGTPVGTSATAHLRSFITPETPTIGEASSLDVVRISSRRQNQPGVDLRPFETVLVQGIGGLVIPAGSGQTAKILAGLYVLPIGHPPDWYQLHMEAKIMANGDATIEFQGPFRVVGDRPLVKFTRAG